MRVALLSKPNFFAQLMVLVVHFSKWSTSERLFAVHLDVEHALILRVSQHVEPRTHIPPSTAGLGVRPAKG